MSFIPKIQENSSQNLKESCHSSLKLWKCELGSHPKNSQRTGHVINFSNFCTFRCNRVEMFCKKDVLKEFAKFTGQH